MLHNTPKILLLAFLTLLLSGCLNEDTQPQPEQSVKGRIVLNSADIEVYTDVATRATLVDFTGYVFTLNGTAVESGTVTNQEITFDNTGTAVIEAGTYTLTVSNESTTQTGVGFPTYSGTSTSFNLSVGGTTNVPTINMGKPSNAKLTIVQDGTFSSKYENATFTMDGRTISLSAAATGTVAYFPAGNAASYTLTAAAKSGSHVTDITGTTSTIDLMAGCYHTLTLKTDPITGVVMIDFKGTHTGEFD